MNGENAPLRVLPAGAYGRCECDKAKREKKKPPQRAAPHRCKDSINGVCVNLLGATAPDWLQSILPEEAIGGGFTSRIIFVVEERKRKTISNPVLSARDFALQKRLAKDLEQLVLLKGRMDFSEDAQEMYESWYEEQDINASKGKYPVTDPRFAGYCERRPTHIKKLCMVLSASRGNEMVVSGGDFTRARKILESVETKMVLAFGGLGSSKYGQITEKLLRFIASREEVKRSQLLTLFYRDVDPETLIIVEDTLSKMGVLKVTLNTLTGDATYKYLKPK